MVGECTEIPGANFAFITRCAGAPKTYSISPLGVRTTPVECIGSLGLTSSLRRAVTCAVLIPGDSYPSANFMFNSFGMCRVFKPAESLCRKSVGFAGREYGRSSFLGIMERIKFMPWILLLGKTIVQQGGARSGMDVLTTSCLRPCLLSNDLISTTAAGSVSIGVSCVTGVTQDSISRRVSVTLIKSSQISLSIWPWALITSEKPESSNFVQLLVLLVVSIAPNVPES